MTTKSLTYSCMTAALVLCSFPLAYAEDTKPAVAPAVGTTIGTTVAVIDLTKVIEQSTAGKELDAKIKAKKEGLKKEAEGYETALREKEHTLLTEIKALDPKNADDRKKGEEKKKAFDEEILKKRQDIVKKNGEIEKAKFTAVKTLQANVAKVAADIADERKIQVVLDRQAVLIAIQGLDITDEALKRLNASVKSVPLKAAE